MGSPSVSANTKRRLVRVAPPRGEDALRQLHQTLIIFAAEPDPQTWATDSAGLHICKAPEVTCCSTGGFFHGKSIAATLEMVVAENRGAHDGKIGVAAHNSRGNRLMKSSSLRKVALSKIFMGVAGSSKRCSARCSRHRGLYWRNQSPLMGDGE